MKIKEGFVLKEIAGVNVVVPIASQMVSFKAIISLNESGAFLWKQLETEKDEAELLKAFLSEYDIDEQTAKTGRQTGKNGKSKSKQKLEHTIIHLVFPS